MVSGVNRRIEILQDESRTFGRGLNDRAFPLGGELKNSRLIRFVSIYCSLFERGDVFCKVDDGDIIAEGLGDGIGGAARGACEVGDAIVAVL